MESEMNWLSTMSEADKSKVAKIEVNSYNIYYYTKNIVKADPGIQLLDTMIEYDNEAELLQKFRHLLPYDLHEKMLFSVKLTPRTFGQYDSLEFDQKIASIPEKSHLKMFLIHYPAAPNSYAKDASNNPLATKAWLAVSKANETDFANAFGVLDSTNYHILQLTEVVAVGPSVQSMFWYSFYYFKFADGMFNNLYLKNTVVVQSLARRYNMTASEILFLWALQRGESVVPKQVGMTFQTEPTRLNFRLAEDDLTMIDIGILRVTRGPVLSGSFF